MQCTIYRNSGTVSLGTIKSLVALHDIGTLSIQTIAAIKVEVVSGWILVSALISHGTCTIGIGNSVQITR